MEKLTSIKLHLNLLIFCGFCIISSSSFITKSYAVNICERTNTMEEILLSLNLKNELLNNTPVCTSEFFYLFEIIFFFTVVFGILKG